MILKRIIRYFKRGNVCVCGLRGRGKDLLFANVILRRKTPYISNFNYGGNVLYQKLDFDNLNVGKNTYDSFIKNDINYYKFPYILGSDIYVSDIGVYLPSQYCNELNKKYPYLATYQALSRQVSHNNFHFNVQNLNRCWDKIREQSDFYILCNRCFYIKGLNIVIQKITIYDKYQSAVDRVKPNRIKVPLLGDKNAKMSARIYCDKFRNTYGLVRSAWLVYKNKSNYDTLYFEELLKGGKKYEEKK